MLLVLAAFVAGAIVGWVGRGGDSSPRDRAQRPVVTTTSAPTPPETTLPTAPPGDPDAHDPGSAPEADKSAPPLALQHTVEMGQSFWMIAEGEVARVSPAPPTDAQITTYWQSLVDANLDRLVEPGNADLLYPGQVVDLPPLAAVP